LIHFYKRLLINITVIADVDYSTFQIKILEPIEALCSGLSHSQVPWNNHYVKNFAIVSEQENHSYISYIITGPSYVPLFCPAGI